MSKKLLIQGIDQILQPLGFKRKNLIWYRTTGSFDEVVDLQLSSGRDRFTLNVGIIDRTAYEMYFGRKLQSPALDHTWTLKIRAGDLLNGKDVWWGMRTEHFPGEFIGLLVNVAIPLLGSLQNHATLVERLENEAVRMRGYPFPLINIAIQRWRMGMHAEARQMLVSLREKVSGAWCVKIDEILGRLA